MQHDLWLRAAARSIYDDFYPPVNPGRSGFDEAERFRASEYRQAVGAAYDVRSLLAAQHDQPLFAAML